jgi:hypothetical protein
VDTFEDALIALRGIVERYEKQLAEAGGENTRRRDAARLRIQRDTVQAALDELARMGEDVHDVPAAVVELAGYLRTGPTPPHPYAGVRAGTGEVGHCGCCLVVGHLVAHPVRSCGEVGCTAVHEELAAGLPAAPGELSQSLSQMLRYPPEGPFPS